MKRNILLDTDSYKLSHFKQYPPGTTNVTSYIEARGGDFSESVFFGLQAWIKANLLTPITEADVEEYEAIGSAHGLPVNPKDMRYIIAEHGGYLPLEIRAVAEGSVVPINNVLVQVENTDERLLWLTSYMETSLLRSVWYPTTVATLSREAKKRIYQGLMLTSDDPEGQIPFKLHDFGARGASSEETAALGGMAHLVNFMGTDTLSGILAARRFYGADMPGFSIPASEHSTMTTWGRDGESAAFKNMLTQFGGEGKLVACVSDSYDIFAAVDELWGDELREAVQSTGGTLVVRPDSGDPVKIPIEVVERLMAKFGHETNSKGYRVLPASVRVIQGDGMSLENIVRVVTTMEERGLSIDNIAFGMGGGLLQKVDRDTMKFAMKANAVKINGQWQDVYKDPITDQGKRSKRGRLGLINQCGIGTCDYRTVPADIFYDEVDPRANLLVPVYRNGELLVEHTFDEVRERAAVA
ncbi:MAG: nicotinate phosphoribosyltransferase [Patescibacteria group bacterium]